MDNKQPIVQHLVVPCNFVIATPIWLADFMSRNNIIYSKNDESYLDIFVNECILRAKYILQGVDVVFSEEEFLVQLSNLLLGDVIAYHSVDDIEAEYSHLIKDLIYYFVNILPTYSLQDYDLYVRSVTTHNIFIEVT